MITFLEISLRRVTSSCFYTAISQNALRSASPAHRYVSCHVEFNWSQWFSGTTTRNFTL